MFFQNKDPEKVPFREELLAAAELSLGVKLPESYIKLLRTRNGGRPINRRVCTTFRTSWAKDHFEIHSLIGVGGSLGIDGEYGSRYMIAEWDYADVGVVIAFTPSAGHDTVMLDYSKGGEPSVVYVDEDRIPRTVAPNFAEFIAALQPVIEIE